MLWAHTRQIDVIAQKGLLLYKIPLCMEGPRRIHQIVLALDPKALAIPQPKEPSELIVRPDANIVVQVQPLGFSVSASREAQGGALDPWAVLEGESYLRPSTFSELR